MSGKSRLITFYVNENGCHICNSHKRAKHFGFIKKGNSSMHRFIYECHTQSIPNWWKNKQSPKDSVLIHHINENKSDNRISNMKLVTHIEHGKIHTGRESTNKITRLFVNKKTGERIISSKSDNPRFHKAVYNKSKHSGDFVYICDEKDIDNTNENFIKKRIENKKGVQRTYRNINTGEIYIGNWSDLVKQYGWKFQAATYRGKSGDIQYLGLA